MKKQGRIMRIVFGALSTAAVVFLTLFAASCGDDDDGATPLCEDGEEVMQDSPDGGVEIPTGIEHCADGSWHRYAALECTETPPGADLCTYDCEDLGGCAPDEVCVDAYMDECACVSFKSCTTDADCASGEACICRMAGNPPAQCLPAECRTDADCGSFECGVDWHDDSYRMAVLGLACRTASDTCHGNTDCGGNFYCGYNGSSWSCAERSEGD